MVTFDPHAARVQIDPLIERVEEKTYADDAMYGPYFRVPEAESQAMQTRMLAAITRWAPQGSVYSEEAERILARRDHASKNVLSLSGVLQGLKADIEAGYMQTVEELVHADVFADFIAMAEELVGKNYKDAAAVITGSVLEEHLRKLAGKHGIATQVGGKPVKADTLNAELVKASAYNKLTQKSVTAWLDLRNNAAHGHYDEYDRAQVEAMIRDVRSVMERHPA
jgi:hypothetical protein